LREQTTSEFTNPFLVLPLPPPSPRCAPVRLKGARRTTTMESTAHHGNRRLSKDQEDIIVGVVQAFSTNNLPLSKMQIREAVANRWGIQVSEPWVRRFLCRHHLHLRTRRCKALADKRQGMEMIANVKGFLDELTDFLKTHHFTSSSVMNFDETRIVVKGGNLTTQRVIDASKERANASSTRNSTVASLLTFAAANGSIFMSVYVLKAKFDEEGGSDVNFALQRATKVTRRSWPRFFTWTDTGFVNAELFGKIIDLVTEEWTTRNPGLPLLLFGDQCSAHMSAETLERALRRAVYLFFLTANASHFLQPLDAEPFACFHHLLRATNESYVFDAILSGHATRNALLAAAYHSERRAFTPQVVSKAFITTGLWPLNPKVVLDRAFENLGVVAPGVTVRDEARLMAAETIAAARRRSEKTAKGVSSGTVAVQRGALHSPYLLLDAARKRAAEEEAMSAQRRARKAARMEKKAAKLKSDQEAVVARLHMTCRICDVSRHRGGGGWKVCLCGHWRACPKCKDTLAAGCVIAKHTENCSVGFEAASK